MLPFTKTFAHTEEYILDRLYKRTPLTVTPICTGVQTLTVYVTTTETVDASSNWVLVGAVLSGWASGVASAGCDPLGIYSPITGLKFVANGTPAVEVA